MEQRVVLYIHHATKSFFVSVKDNSDRYDYESSVDRQVQHAQSLYRRLLKDDSVSSLRSGWMFALINTDFTGWYRSEDETIYPDIASAIVARDRLIEEWSQSFHFVGTEGNYMKGTRGEGKSNKGWVTRFNPENMTKAKIVQKIDIVTSGLTEPFPPSLINDCYLAIVCPDTHGPRSKNYGSYTVDSLSTLFRFVRQSLGKDMGNAQI